MAKVRTLGRTHRNRSLPRQVVWEYDPTERQIEFHTAPERYKLYGGAMGGGKTVALCAEAVRLSLKYPGNRGYFCRNTLTDFKRSTLITFGRIVPSALIRSHHTANRLIEFWNGSEILYGGLGNSEEIERIKSTEFGWFGIDEATETLEDHFLMLQSRLRWKLPDGTYPKFHGVLASNPEPGWVKDRFVDSKLDDHRFVPALPKENPHLPAGYDVHLRSNYPDEWVKRYLDGSWDVFEGQVYKEFTREKHIFPDDLQIPSTWERMRIIDHGYTNPTCCLWAAVDQDGVIWIYDEHYEREMLISQHARIIREKDPYFDGVTLIDPSCFSNTMQKGNRPVSVADEYRENGIIAISPYQRDGKVEEGVGINLVKQRLAADQLKISSRCVNTIKEIVKYRWRDIGPSAERPEYEVPVDRDNHAMDCVRYLCCWKPRASKPPNERQELSYLNRRLLRRRTEQCQFAGW